MTVSERGYRASPYGNTVIPCGKRESMLETAIASQETRPITHQIILEEK